MFEDMGEKEFCHFCSINSFGARDNDHPLHKAMVDHDQNRIFATYFREVGDKVHRELFEGEQGGQGDQVQGQLGGVSVHFVLLADCTSFNELVDISG